MTDPKTDQLYSDPALAQLYDWVGGDRADFVYCRMLASGASSVLDLGCGTGALAVSLVEANWGRREVTGVDPAAAMLDIARDKPGGRLVRWALGDATTIRLGQSYDLIVLTGHTFQFFLSDDDQQAALATIAAHLNPGGRFVFDSRNPLRRSWEGKTKATTIRQFDHPQLGPIESWSEPHFDDATGVLRSVNSYRIVQSGKVLSAPLVIRFTSQVDIAARVKSAGLSVTNWLGDWQGGGFQPRAQEIIAVGGRG